MANGLPKHWTKRLGMNITQLDPGSNIGKVRPRGTPEGAGHKTLDFLNTCFSTLPTCMSNHKVVILHVI